MLWIRRQRQDVVRLKVQVTELGQTEDLQSREGF